MARPRNLNNPEELEALFNEYKKDVKSKPFLVKDWVGKDGYQVYREKEKPLTLEGFYNYCRKVIGEVHQYFEMKEQYIEFLGICRAIKEEIRQDQIEGGMAMIYNPSITQRLNGLVEKTQTDIKVEQPLFNDVPKKES